MSKTYKAIAVCHMTGFSLTLRQLQWWDETGILCPIHVKHKRIYTEDQALQALILWKLKRKGMTIQELRKFSGKLGPIAQAAQQQSSFLLLSRDNSYFCKAYSVAEISDMEKGPVYVVNLERLRGLIEEEYEAA